MRFMRPGTWGRLTLGTLLIGGTLALLWAIYQPSLPGGGDDDSDARPAAARLTDTRATLTVRRAGEGRTHRAVVTCDGARRRASGFWEPSPATACDALASTRAALLSGPGCREPSGTVLTVAGRLAGRRFRHAARRGGCPDPDGWLAVNVLAAPVLEPDRELDDLAAP